MKVRVGVFGGCSRKRARVTIDGADFVDDAAGADGVVLADEADAGMGDAECDTGRQGKGPEDWEESSSSASVDVSSGYDDSSSSDYADDSDKGRYESASGWKEPARVRKSDRLLDLIQVPTTPPLRARHIGAPLWCMSTKAIFSVDGCSSKDFAGSDCLDGFLASCHVFRAGMLAW
jgi:hypothetical protein